MIISNWVKASLLRLEIVDDFFGARSGVLRSKLLARFIPPGGVGCELGVFKGHLSKAILRIIKPQKLYMVDLWYLGGNWDWACGNTCAAEGLRKVIASIKVELMNERAELVIGDDIKFLQGLPDNFLDWAYIDSSHDYEHTILELELLVKKVKDAGLICGDDWVEDSSHRHFGVSRAVREFTSKGIINLLYCSTENRQWVAEVL